MINLITGRKGSGKTKQLIELVNTALGTTKGHVVVIEQGIKLRPDIKYTARLIDTNEYRIQRFDALYGFLAGIAAGNYDITDVFVDGVLRICTRDYDALGDMFDRLASLDTGIKFTFTVSADVTELPESVKKFL